MTGYNIKFYLLCHLEGEFEIFNSKDGLIFKTICDYGEYEKMIKELITEGALIVKKDRRKKNNYNNEIIKVKKFKTAKGLVKFLEKAFSTSYRKIYRKDIK